PAADGPAACRRAGGVGRDERTGDEPAPASAARDRPRRSGRGRRRCALACVSAAPRAVRRVAGVAGSGRGLLGRAARRVQGACGASWAEGCVAVSSTDSVTTSVEVAVDPLTAFEVFTEEIDSWYQRGPHSWKH